MISKILKNHWPEFFLLASLLFFFRQILFFGQTFVPFGLGLGDHNLSTVPLLYYLADSLKQNQIPLWDPYTLGGLPFTSSILGFYQPLNFFFFRFLPFPIALNLYIFLIFLILAFATFYFVKSLKLSSEAALITSLSFVFASGIMARMIHLAVIETIAYLPLLLLLSQKYFEKRNPLIVVVTGVILALQILVAHQPTAFISSFAFIGFFLFKISTSPKPRKIILSLITLFLIYLIGISLSAVSILPIWPIFQASDRSQGVSEAQFEEHPFHPGELKYFLRPTPIGNPSLGNYDSPYLDPGIFWENTAYIGLLNLTLAIIALLFLSRSKKIVLFFGALFFLSVIVALGKYAPLSFLWQFPPFFYFRMPARFLLLAIFSLTILSAFGFDGLTQKYVKKRSYLGFLAAIIILLDLIPFDSTYNAVYSAQKWLSPPQTAQFLKEDPSFFRYYSLGGYEAYYDVYRQFRGWQKNVEPYFNLRENLALNLNLLHHLNLAGSGGGISKTARYQESLYQNLGVRAEENLAQPNSQALKMLRLLNVKYLISHFKIQGADFTLRKEIKFSTGQPGFYLYELKNPLPHAFLVYQAENLNTPSQVLSQLNQESFNPQNEVLLEEPFEGLSRETSTGKAEVIRYLPQSVAIKAKTASPAFLLLTDTNFPGWEAQIDGQPAKIYQADYLFRAVKLEGGEHEVEFSYHSKEFFLGAQISLVSLLVIFLFSVFWIILQKRKTRPSKGP